MNRKAKIMIDIEVDFTSNPTSDPLPALCSALYESGRGTRHFYEAVDLIVSACAKSGQWDLVEIYEKELNELE